MIRCISDKYKQVISALAFGALIAGAPAFAQTQSRDMNTDMTNPPAATGTTPETTAAPGAGSATSTMAGPKRIDAELIEVDKQAINHAATVQVTVQGVELVDPSIAASLTNKNQGHLHYQVDNGPIIATPATKLSFHNLTEGQHRILVRLAGNNHAPLGPEETLYVTVPGKNGSQTDMNPTRP